LSFGSHQASRFLALILVATTAHAGSTSAPETVRVNGQYVLSGVWMITRPQSASVATFRDDKFGPMEPGFCRIEQSQDKLGVHCVGPSPLWEGTGHVDGTNLHLAWGSFLLRLVIDGTLRSPTEFTGIFSVKVSGIAYSDPDSASGTKLNLADASPDTSAQAALLARALSQIEGGQLSEPHDDAALARNAEDEFAAPPTPDDLRGLGSPQMVFYLGHTNKWDGLRSRPDYFKVYDVEFANGERVCEVHQTDGGVLDGLICA